MSNSKTRLRLYISWALTLFIILTNNWMGWDAGIKAIAWDAASYEIIAQAAPSLRANCFFITHSVFSGLILRALFQISQAFPLRSYFISLQASVYLPPYYLCIKVLSAYGFQPGTILSACPFLSLILLP